MTSADLLLGALLLLLIVGLFGRGGWASGSVCRPRVGRARPAQSEDNKTEGS